MKIREFLTDEGKWTKGAGARDKNGEVVPYFSNEAISHCLVGALYRCYELSECREKEEEIVKKLGMPMATWNDAPERKFEEVRALIEELDI